MLSGVIQIDIGPLNLDVLPAPSTVPAVEVPAIVLTALDARFKYLIMLLPVSATNANLPSLLRLMSDGLENNALVPTPLLKP